MNAITGPVISGLNQDGVIYLHSAISQPYDQNTVDNQSVVVKNINVWCLAVQTSHSVNMNKRTSKLNILAFIEKQ